MVALLRGVNVGGRNRLAMADLRAIAAARGYERVRTYIQSGNLVLWAPEGAPEDVAARLEEAIAAQTGLASAVVVRTAHELASVVERNPYHKRGEDPSHLHVVFLNRAAEASIPLEDLDAYAPEEAVAIGREIYLFLPSGMGRSKLATDLARQKGPAGTTRNWRTVTTLLEMAMSA